MDSYSQLLLITFNCALKIFRPIFTISYSDVFLLCVTSLASVIGHAAFNSLRSILIHWRSLQFFFYLPLLKCLDIKLSMAGEQWSTGSNNISWHKPLSRFHSSLKAIKLVLIDSHYFFATPAGFLPAPGSVTQQVNVTLTDMC